MTGLAKTHFRGGADELSDWTLPPPGARSMGETEPVRVFDTAEAALMFLEQQNTAPAPSARRAGRVLPAEAVR